VDIIKDVLSGISGEASGRGLLVTDAGSTKKEIVDFARDNAPGIRFVGSHPLAGSEKAGVAYSGEDLFEGSVCVVTPGEEGENKDVDAVKDLWAALGAKVVVMTPSDHDRNLALSSHLPHVAAYALVGALGDGFPKDMLATGFRDTTRIASSDAELWTEIFISNRDNILSAVEKYREELSRIESMIKSRDHDGMKKLLENIKKERDDAFRKD